MDSGMVSKIEKARRYAEEKDRISFQALQVRFRGSSNTYKVTYSDGKWGCQCNFFQQRGVCSHTMAMERILSGMLGENVPVGEEMAG